MTKLAGSILIVETSPERQLDSHDVLSQAGYDVHVARLEQKPLDTALDLQPNLILVDVGAANPAIEDLFRHLKACPELDTSLIVCCCDHSLVQDVAMFSQEADDVLICPTSDVALESRVATLLHLQQAEQRLRRVDRFLQAMDRIAELIDSVEKPQLLLQTTCDALGESGLYTHAWIALLDEGQPLTVASNRGELSVECCEQLVIRVLDAMDGASSPSVMTVVVPRLHCLQNKLTAGKELWAAPLANEGQVYGLLAVTIPELWIPREEPRLFQHLAADLGAALHRLHRERQRRETSVALHESEMRFRKIYEHASFGIAIVDQAGHILRANPFFCDLLGYTEDALMKLTTVDITHPDDWERETAEVQKLMAGQRSVVRLEKRYLTKDGAVVWVNLTANLIWDEAGAFKFGLGMVEDITERKEAEAQLQRLLDRQMAVNRLALAIGDTQNLERIYHIIYEHVVELMDSHAFIVSTYDDVKREIRAGYVISHHQEIVDVSEFPPLPLGEPGSGTQSQVIHSGEPLYVPDWRAAMQKANVEYRVAENGSVHEGPPPQEDKEITQSGILVPMKVEGKTIGVLQVQSHKKDAYSQEDVDLLASLGNVAAVAIQNSRLYNRLQQELVERRRIESALRESEARYRLLFNSASDSIFIHDLNGKILEVNQRACERLGYSREELLNMSPADIDAPEYVEEIEKYLEQIGQHDHRLIESVHVRKDGTRFPVELSTRFIYYNDQPALFTVARDITERKEIQRRLRQQERLAAVGQLAGGIAHDFNNLLTTIILYAQMPLSQPDLSPRVRQSLDVIQGESQKAAELIQQILDFSRRGMMKSKPVDLKPFIQESLYMLRRTLPATIDLQLSLEYEAHYVVNADPTRIQQALMNLVLNARDAMPAGGKIEIRIRRHTFSAETMPVAEMAPGRWVSLTVADEGTGISDEVFSHLFEPFYTTKEPGEGTGLGLAQVYGIVKLHHGYIDVQTRVGEGSAFHLYLPEHEGVHAERTAPKQEALPRGRGERLLIAEDEVGVRQAIEEILEPLGYHICATADGRAALTAYHEHEGNFDLVITDLVMPEMDGMLLARNLRDIDPALKIIGITGYAVVDDLEDVRDGHVWDAIIQKPFEVRLLAEKVRAILDED